uniref:Uncharacterized protein n=1 Tax=Anguilla anguilla TaxID=7936 RepID=A0A0E9SE51_ANGAN
MYLLFDGLCRWCLLLFGPVCSVLLAC